MNVENFVIRWKAFSRRCLRRFGRLLETENRFRESQYMLHCPTEEDKSLEFIRLWSAEQRCNLPLGEKLAEVRLLLATCGRIRHTFRAIVRDSAIAPGRSLSRF